MSAGYYGHTKCAYTRSTYLYDYGVTGPSRLHQLGFGSMVANLVDFHFMSPSSSEGNITNLSINKVIVLISY